MLALVAGRDARAKPVDFDIPAGNVAARLPEFGKLSGLDIDYSELADPQRFDTRAVKGTYEPIDALRLMLSGPASCGAARSLRGRGGLCGGDRRPRVRRACAGQRRLEAATARTETTAAPLPIPAAMEELVVTGSIMRGVEQSPSVITLSNRDIESRTPRGAIWEALQDQPAVHGSGPTEDTSEIGTDAPTNSGRGIGINLRGFGAGATLVLVNGHRIAASGTDAAFTDISNLSNLFVEETELLADATSAVYGSDAVAGVVNFNLRREFTGGLTRVRYGGAAGDELEHREIGQLFGWNWDRTRWWSERTCIRATRWRRRVVPGQAAISRATAAAISSIPLSNPGNVLTPAGMLAIPHGQDGSNLARSDLIAGAPNLTDRHAHSDLISAQRMQSAYASRAVRAARRTSASRSMGTSRTRRARARTGSAVAGSFLVPFSNPFAKQIATPTAPALVLYDFFDDLGADDAARQRALGFRDWQLRVSDRERLDVGGYARRATERQHQSIDNLANPDRVAIALRRRSRRRR